MQQNLNCTPEVGHRDQRLEVQFMGKELFTEEFKMIVVQYDIVNIS